MPIDNRMYQKYTGKLPGEAMTRYGESLAKSAGERSRQNSGEGAQRGFIRILGMNFRIRMLTSVICSLAALIGLLLGFR